MEAVYSSSMRNKDSGMEREDKVKRLVGGWRSGSVLEFFLAWRELAVSLRDIQQARGSLIFTLPPPPPSPQLRAPELVLVSSFTTRERRRHVFPPLGQSSKV